MGACCLSSLELLEIRNAMCLTASFCNKIVRDLILGMGYFEVFYSDNRWVVDNTANASINGDEEQLANPFVGDVLQGGCYGGISSWSV